MTCIFFYFQKVGRNHKKSSMAKRQTQQEASLPFSIHSFLLTECRYERKKKRETAAKQVGFTQPAVSQSPCLFCFPIFSFILLDRCLVHHQPFSPSKWRYSSNAKTINKTLRNNIQNKHENSHGKQCVS